MSYTEMFAFGKDGKAYDYADIENSWLGGMAIWNTLSDKYFGSPISMFSEASNRRVWNLLNDKKVDDGERLCLATTFDNVVLKRDDFQRAIDAFEAFPGETSLKEQADVLRDMLEDENIIACAWNQTSVNTDVWACHDYDEEREEYIPYDLNAGDKHQFIQLD